MRGSSPRMTSRLRWACVNSSACTAFGLDPAAEFFRRDRAVALENPVLQQVEGRLVAFGEARRDPAGAAQAIAGWRGERQRQGHLERDRQFHAHAELPVLSAQERENLAVHLDDALAPGKLLVRFREA